MLSSPELSGWEESPGAEEQSADRSEASGSSGRSNNNLNVAFQHGYMAPNYNVAPKTRVPVLRRRKAHDDELLPPALESQRWGLIPSWQKNDEVLKTINARDDTVLSGSGMWRHKNIRRCVIFVEG